MTMHTEKLELKHLCGYLPYGLKCKAGVKYSERVTKQLIADLIGIDNWSSGVQYIVKPYDVHGVAWDQNLSTMSIKPLLIPLSALKDDQWIEVFKAGFKGVFTHEHVYLGENQYIEKHANAIEMICPGFSVSFDFNNMQFGTEPYAFNQLAAFSKLYELHADLHGLIDAGLALNKLDYEK